MRLSADAKAYAAGFDMPEFSTGTITKGSDDFPVVLIDGKEFEVSTMEQYLAQRLAEAFQHGFDHAKASQRRLEKLAKK